MVVVTAVRVLADVHVVNPQLVIGKRTVGIRDVGPSCPDGLDLRAGQYDASRERGGQEILVFRLPVLDGNLCIGRVFYHVLKICAKIHFFVVILHVQ